MKKLLARLRYYSFAEGFSLIMALFLDSLYKRIPKQVFLVNNTYKHLVQNGAILRRERDEISIFFQNAKYRLRVNGSDFLVFNQIVFGGGMKRVIEIIRHLNIENPYIMDCGANIGLATVELKKEFPNAKIIAVEPEADNYKQLCKNISSNGFEDVEVVMMGVWYNLTYLTGKTDFRDGSEWSFALQESAESDLNSIQVDTPQNIAARFGWNVIDILKIDIEGSEFPLLRNISQWKEVFDTVKVISIEVHEEVGSIDEIISLLKNSNFKVEIYQELLIGVRNE